MAEPGTVWTPAELRTFLAVARRHRLFAFFHVAAYTGARRGELLNLRWADVDLDGKQITITGSAGVVEGERLEGTTKSGRKRIVSIDDETVTALREHHKAQSASKLLAGESWRGEKDGHVFATSWSDPIYPDTVTALPRKLINTHNHPKEGSPRPNRCRPRGCTTYGTSTPRRFSWPVSPSTSSPRGSATATRRSRSGSTPT